MFVIPSTSVDSGAEKPQGTNKPLKGGKGGKIVLLCLHQEHKCLLNNSTLSLGDNILRNLTVVSLFRGYKQHNCKSPSLPSRPPTLGPEGNAVTDLDEVHAFKTRRWGWKSLAKEKQKTSEDKEFCFCVSIFTAN